MFCNGDYGEYKLLNHCFEDGKRSRGRGMCMRTLWKNDDRRMSPVAETSRREMTGGYRENRWLLVIGMGCRFHKMLNKRMCERGKSWWV